MKKNTCFVMMPFDNSFEEYYKDIYQPAIESCHLQARRADSIYRPSPILHDIWDFINDSELVIADITGRNPNVMYELGLAHAIAKPAIIITNNINDVPFDLKALRILVYNTNKPSWAIDLKNSIIKSIHEIKSSPTDAILPTFLKVATNKREEVSEIKKDLIDIKQYLYRLDFEGSEHFNEIKPRVLNQEEYNNAIKDAHNFYYDQGLDISQIKVELMKKYMMSSYTAEDVLLKVRIG